MSTLLATGLTNVVMATALALCAAVVGRFCKRPALTHSLWLLVLLKLVTPPLVPLPVHWLEAPQGSSFGAARQIGRAHV